MSRVMYINVGLGELEKGLVSKSCGEVCNLLEEITSSLMASTGSSERSSLESLQKEANLLQF